MTGPIDTAAKRRQAQMAALDCELAGVSHELIDDVLALCDALDAARAALKQIGYEMFDVHEMRVAARAALKENK